ncbi:2'-5' RNA ligase family protein [Kribbella jejuensis]|uniref:2'-5' RNA ligase n=1 Tax=Kribbella jejuensis TaxID=236068 RepID=A0A542ERS4_9ACTN|nr:2'-5' RNA ligase family protein [Kribbella jejuensis]TQJ18051.1 2'-5' RNA ligase [Kribbella jejuensis]
MFEEVRDHWCCRPDRPFYSWHITFTDCPEIAALQLSYAELIDELPGFTAVPPQWLHLTVHGVGFTDRVPDSELADIVEATRHRIAELSAFPVTVGPAVLDPESILLPVRPIQPFQHLRDLVRAAIFDVWGEDSVPRLPEIDPHVVLGYSHLRAPAAPIAARVQAYPEQSTTSSVSALTLLSLTRTGRLYHWIPKLTIPFGSRAQVGEP